MSGKLLEMAGDFLAEQDDGALVRCGDESIEELLVLAVFGGIAASELLAPEDFLQVVEDD
jgi:hypothetical protein